MFRRSFLIGAPLALAGCATESVWAPDVVLDRVRYVDPGPKSLTLITMRNVGSGRGAHSALLINASERVLWDPAGSFKHETIPERNDLIYGVSPRISDFYISYHSRETFYTDIQEVEVSPEVAEMAFAAARVAGPVQQANCARVTSQILRSLPGFEFIRVTWFPEKLEEQFAKVPGVKFRTLHEDDADDKSVAAAQIDAAIRAGQ